MKCVHRAAPALTVDPALTPFLDKLAELLAAEEERLAEARRALCLLGEKTPLGAGPNAGAERQKEPT